MGFAKNAHRIATIIFCIAVLPLLFSWLKRMLAAIYDIKWMLILGGHPSKKKQCLLVSLTLGKI
nr:hypothetical protein [uncultured Campylobacter sp.]